MARPDVTKGEVPIAFVALNATVKDHADLEAEIIEHVAKRLGRALRPAAVRFVTELPRTRNGKLARRAIRDALNSFDRTL